MMSSLSFSRHYKISTDEPWSRDSLELSPGWIVIPTTVKSLLCSFTDTEGRAGAPHGESPISFRHMPLSLLTLRARYLLWIIDVPSAALEILKLLILKCPEAARHANNDGSLPIHHAAWGGKGGWGRSPEFCRVLIEAYPGSERIVNHRGKLPLHKACARNAVATVEYLYSLYPDAVHHAVADGKYPIHFAIVGMNHIDSPTAAVDVVHFLLYCDPTVKLQRLNGMMSLLRYACDVDYNDSNIEAGIQLIKAIYDSHPKVIESNRIASDIQRYHDQVQAFINGEMVYARQAKDHRLMTTPDDNGQLPLHKTLQNNVRLGSIKLLVKDNPSAIRTSDKGGVIPLHEACQHHDSSDVVQYLVGLDKTALRAADFDSNTALHHACSGAKYDTITLLLEKYDAISVSKRSTHGKLPIDLLWESNVVEDRESIEYTESVFRLLKAYPEMVMNYNGNMKQPADADANQNGKKRKFGHQG
eukprot:scaffold10306_cov75-Skeletonema_marinoi.AAC.16